MIREPRSFDRIRYTAGRTEYPDEKLFGGAPGTFHPDPSGETVVHFLFAGLAGTTICGMEGGPHPEEVEDDVSVTCQECRRRAHSVFRWWFPRRCLPSWLGGAP